MNDSATLLVIPDSQTLVHYRPEAYRALTEWAARPETGIAAALHVGDVVDSGGVDEGQYLAAAEVHQVLLDAGIPLIVAPGNHDYDNTLWESRSLRLFNRYVGDRIREQPGFGGSFEAGAAENSYLLADTPAGPIVMMALEFGPRPAVIAWADRILSEFADRSAFVTTHSYLDPDGALTAPRSRFHPRAMPGARDGCDGKEMWRDLFSHHDNVVAIFSGHQIPGIVSHRVDPNASGRGILQTYQNWQCAPEELQSCVRLIRWNPTTSRVTGWVVDAATGREVDAPGYRFDVHVGPGAEPSSFPAEVITLTRWPDAPSAP